MSGSSVLPNELSDHLCTLTWRFRNPFTHVDGGLIKAVFRLGVSVMYLRATARDAHIVSSVLLTEMQALIEVALEPVLHEAREIVKAMRRMIDCTERAPERKRVRREKMRGEWMPRMKQCARKAKQADAWVALVRIMILREAR